MNSRVCFEQEHLYSKYNKNVNYDKNFELKFDATLNVI